MESCTLDTVELIELIAFFVVFSVVLVGVMASWLRTK